MRPRIPVDFNSRTFSRNYKIHLQITFAALIMARFQIFLYPCKAESILSPIKTSCYIKISIIKNFVYAAAFFGRLKLDVFSFKYGPFSNRNSSAMRKANFNLFIYIQRVMSALLFDIKCIDIHPLFMAQLPKQ